MATIYDALRAYYKFDDSVTPGRDSSGYDNVGTLTSAALTSGGRFGTALRTSSSTGKMSVPDNLSLRQSAVVRFSVSVWINLDKALNTMWGTPAFVDKTGGATRGYFLGVLSGGGNDISFRVHNSAGTTYTATYTESATSGWVHIVGVYEGATVRIYRNGVSQSTAASDGTLRHGTDVMDNIGLGFEGLIDELSVWARMLTSADVTALYAAGVGLELVQPDMERARSMIRSEYIDDAYAFEAFSDADVIDHANPMVLDKVATNPSAYSARFSMDKNVTSPYIIRDSPKRLYLDPHPIILSVTADSAHHVTAIANGGPTDAEDVVTWWEIELLPGQVFVVAERHAHNDYQVNHNQTDTWDIPLGQDWKHLTIRFFIQAVADASQMWASDPVTLDTDSFDNAPIDVPTFTSPAPVVTSATVDGVFNVTTSGHVGPTTSERLQTWWEIDLSGDGQFVSVADLRFPVTGASQQTITDTWPIPLGVNLNGKSVRLAARAEYDSKQVWYSTSFPLTGDGFDHSGNRVDPLPPGPPAGKPQAPDLGRPGPGVFRKRTWDFSAHS